MLNKPRKHDKCQTGTKQAKLECAKKSELKMWVGIDVRVVASSKYNTLTYKYVYPDD